MNPGATQKSGIPFFQPRELSQKEKDLLKRVMQNPLDPAIQLLLKTAVMENPYFSLYIVDDLISARRQVLEMENQSRKTADRLKEIEDEKQEMEKHNKYIGRVLFQISEKEVEVFVNGMGEKVIPPSPDLKCSFRSGEKIYVTGQPPKMFITANTSELYTHSGEYGIMTAISDNLMTATVSVEGKRGEFKTFFPVREMFLGKKITADDLPLPCIVTTEDRSVLEIIPEPALNSELNPFLKRDVTLEHHKGYTQEKFEFIFTLLIRYITVLENRKYLERTGLLSENVPVEVPGISVLGPPGTGKTTLINSAVNLLDRMSMNLVDEKIRVMELYQSLKKNISFEEAKKEFCSIQDQILKNHEIYHTVIGLEEPVYNVSTLQEIQLWAEDYVTGYSVKIERVSAELKRLKKLKQAGRSEVQLFLIRHEDAFKKYVGEGVEYLGMVFQKARRWQGLSIIWFPEAESIFRARGTGISSDINDEIVAKLNEESKGSSDNRNIIEILDSNYPDFIDDSILVHRFTPIKLGRISPEDLWEIVEVHVSMLKFDRSDFQNPDRAAEEACDIICDRLLAPTPIAEALKASGSVKKIIEPKDILVPRIIALIVDRIKGYGLKKKRGLPKTVNRRDILRACHEELCNQALCLKVHNLNWIFNDMEQHEIAKFTHIKPVISTEPAMNY
jgi:ATP-dependent 26S proteasome regulatory subunit